MKSEKCKMGKYFDFSLYESLVSGFNESQVSNLGLSPASFTYGAHKLLRSDGIITVRSQAGDYFLAGLCSTVGMKDRKRRDAKCRDLPGRLRKK
jgi:hypothetical protein